MNFVCIIYEFHKICNNPFLENLCDTHIIYIEKFIYMCVISVKYFSKFLLLK